MAMIVATVQGLQEGQTYYFAATAYSGSKESDYSVEVVPHCACHGNSLSLPLPTIFHCRADEDTPLSGQLSTNDFQSDALTFTVVAQPGHGTVTVQDNTGSFTYTPVLNYWGEDTFSYTVANSAGTSDRQP